MFVVRRRRGVPRWRDPNPNHPDRLAEEFFARFQDESEAKRAALRIALAACAEAGFSPPGLTGDPAFDSAKAMETAERLDDASDELLDDVGDVPPTDCGEYARAFRLARAAMARAYALKDDHSSQDLRTVIYEACHAFEDWDRFGTVARSIIAAP